MFRKVTLGLLLQYPIILYNLINPSLVLAIQTHPHPEGIYVHQLGHVLFGASMLFLLIYLSKRPVGKEYGWRYLKISLILFLVWNINAFFGHIVENYIPDEKIIKKGPFYEHYIDKPHDLLVYLYFFLKLDHLYCVPAMLFFLLALRSFYREINSRTT